MSKITESARGEVCHVRIPGVCRFTADTVVWAHANGSAAGKGLWQKSIDLLGAYACMGCHDLYDRRRVKNDQGVLVDRMYVEVCFWEGHARSVIRLLERGLIVLDRGTVRVAA